MNLSYILNLYRTVLFSLVFCPVASYANNIIKVDGSSTVYPITEAVAEEFQLQNKGIQVTVGISGTGGGFKKLCDKEVDIANASRPIKSSEAELCKKNGVDYLELPVAYDALTVVVNPDNTWLTSLTVSDLKKIWEPQAQGVVTHWSHVRPSWPHEPIKLFGPGVDSGTFDYFTETIVGKAQASRGDYTSSEDDNVLVQGVKSNLNALGYFGLAYFEANSSKVRAVPIDQEKGKGAVMPTVDNVINKSYSPLSRPLFIYVRKDAVESTARFIEFYLNNAKNLARDVGYIQLEEDVYKSNLSSFATFIR